jgi:hypothetical protein
MPSHNHVVYHQKGPFGRELHCFPELAVEMPEGFQAFQSFLAHVDQLQCNFDTEQRLDPLKTGIQNRGLGS